MAAAAEKQVDTDVFEAAGQAGEKTYPIRAGEIKKGMIVNLKDCPCKILEVTTSKTGKHGHAKANITGVDIFTGKKVNDSAPTSHNLTAPFVTTTNLTLTDVTDDGYAVLMDEGGNIREDIKLPDVNSPDPELGAQIRAALDAGKGDVIVIVTKAMDSECITSFKTSEA